MKKIFTLLFAVIMTFEGFSQTYYSWDFTTATSSIFPPGFVTWKLDNASVSTTDFTAGGQTLLNSGAWVLLTVAQQNGSPGTALTTSDFTNTAIQCDRWLVTPRMIIPTGAPNVCLKWTAASGDAGYPDEYQVRISTTDSNTTSFTTLAQDITENAYNTTRILPLASYAGDTIRIAFRDVTTNGYLLFLSSIQLVNLPTVASSITDVEIYEHNYINTPSAISGILMNTGFDTINTYNLNYSANGGTVVTAPITGAGYAPQQSFYYNHPTPFNPTTAGTYTVSVWLSELNGVAGTHSDTNSTTIFYYPKVYGLVKNVVVEEMTGAGCPWCSGGALTLRDDVKNHSYVIPVAIHSADINDLRITPASNADLMQIPDGETVIGALATGFPTAMVDRLYTFDNQSVATGVQTIDGQHGTYQGPGSTYIWDTLSAFREKMATPVNVSLSNLTFDTTVTPASVTVTVNANFLNSLSQGSYRMNLYLVEDSVLTPAGSNGDGYNQDNANYANQSSSGSSELYSLPALLLDNGAVGEYAQNHVLRAMVGGPWGVAGDIPSAPVAGTTYSHTFTATVPTTWRYNYVHLVGLVQEYNTSASKRAILNATEASLIDQNVGIVETSEFNKLMVYPNPSSTMATVEMDLKENGLVTVSMVNILGETVSDASTVLLNSGIHSVKIPVSGLANGLYYVKITSNGRTTALPLSIVK
jgi:hypothetical protein